MQRSLAQSARFAGAPPPTRPGVGAETLAQAVPGAAAPQAAEHYWQIEKDSIVRRFAYFMALAYIFIRLSMIHEIAAFRFGFRTFLPWLAGGPAILAMILSGGLRRTFRHAPAFFWTAFAAWLVIATPFSFWKGESIKILQMYFKSEFPMLFLAAGLAVDWKEYRRILYVIAAAAMVNLVVWRAFTEIRGGRLWLEFGSVANPGDFAAHLLMILPLLLWVILAGSFSWLARLALLLPLAGGCYMVFSTGSRGGFVALLASMLFMLLKAPFRIRLGIAFAAPVLALAVLHLAPQYAVQRQLSLFADEEDVSAPELSEARGSRETRVRLLKDSLRYTLEHPLFGVGPGEFADYRGTVNQVRGLWQVTHNTYTQVSSEAGIPAFVFFMGALFTTYRLLSKLYKRTRRDKRLRQISYAALCLMLSLVGFSVSIFFLTLAYGHSLLLISGLAISLAAVAEREIRALPTAPSNAG